MFKVNRGGDIFGSTGLSVIFPAYDISYEMVERGRGSRRRKNRFALSPRRACTKRVPTTRMYMYYTHDELEPRTEIIPCNRSSFTISSRRSRRSHDREDRAKREKLVTKVAVEKKKKEEKQILQSIILKISLRSRIIY